MTARERVEYLVDSGSLIEYGLFARPGEESLQGGKAWMQLVADSDDDTIRRGAGDGIVGGYGEISGRGVFIVAYDFDVYGGSMGANNDTKMARIRKAALQYGKPLIYLLEGGGARVQERMGSQAAKGHDRFHDLARLSGWAPIVSAITGPSFAGHANIAGLSDYVPMLETASLGLAGPKLVEAAVGEKVSASELGGPPVHLRNGSVDSVFATEDSLLDAVKEFVRRMPSNASEYPPRRNFVSPDESQSEGISDIVPSNPYAPYDMQRIIDAIIDGDSWFEMRCGFAQNVITGLGYLGGLPIGVVANNPLVLAGALDRDGSDKITRFVMFCNAFNIPLLYLVDTPGNLVGSGAERAGMVRHAVGPLFALGQANVPRLTVIVRKAYGIAYHAMGGGEFDPDLIIAWPSAEISPMGPEGAARVIGQGNGGDYAVMVDSFREASKPWRAAMEVRIDDVVAPRDTRSILIRTLEMAFRAPRHTRPVPPKKSGIIPY